MPYRGLLLVLQRLDPRGIDAGTLEHGPVGPPRVQVPAQKENGCIRPFPLIEALLKRLDPAPVSRWQAADTEDVTAFGLAVFAPLTQALFQLIERQQLAVQIGLTQLQTALHRVRVRVDKPWHQHLAAQVDDARVRLFEPQHLSIGTHRRDLAVLDRNGLLQGLARFGGVHPGVVQDEIDSSHTFHRGTGQNK
ncbi:hypothetical protein D3C81_967780 [compost metagenome]